MIYFVYGKGSSDDINDEDFLTSFEADNNKAAKQYFNRNGYANVEAVLFDENYNPIIKD